AATSPITVTKSASSTTIASGAQLTYTIVIKNTGGAALSNLTFTDQVNGLGVIQNPPALPQLTISSTKGSCTQGGANGNLVTCNGGAVNQGQNATITITGTTPAAGTLTNTAVVDPNNSIQESNELNNTSAAVNTSVSGPPPAPLLSIQKTDGKPATGAAWAT